MWKGVIISAASLLSVILLPLLACVCPGTDTTCACKYDCNPACVFWGTKEGENVENIQVATQILCLNLRCSGIGIFLIIQASSVCSRKGKLE